MKKIFVLLSFLLAASYTYCQSDSSEQERTHISTGAQFISNQTYAGRTDSLKLPVMVPEFNLQFPKGLFLNTKGYLNLSGGKTTFDGISIEPGYEFSKKNWNGSFSVIKNFISDSSNLIIAPVNASLEFYLSKETKVVTPYLGSEYVFSAEGNDLIVYTGLSRSIVFSKPDANTSFDMEPSLGLTGGTQNFYYSFLKSYSSNGKTRSISKTKGRGGSGTTTSTTGSSTPTTVKKQSQTFSLLSSSFELPFTLTAHKFKWVTTPSLEVPVNLLQTTSGGQSSSAIFYITTELLFTF